MDRPKKSDIKKMIADLHAKKNASKEEGGHDVAKGPPAKSTKGGSHAGRYRPKI